MKNMMEAFFLASIFMGFFALFALFRGDHDIADAVIYLLTDGKVGD